MRADDERTVRKDLRAMLDIVRRAHGHAPLPEAEPAREISRERIGYVEQAMVHRVKPTPYRRTRKKPAVTAEERLAS